MGKILYRFRYYLMAIVVAMTGISMSLLPGLRINQEFSHYFPEKDPDLGFYKQLTQVLGDEDDLLSIAVSRDEGILDSAFLDEFHRFQLSVRDIPGVTGTTSLTNLSEPVKTPFGMIPVPFLHYGLPDRYSEDSTKISRDPRLIKRLISADFKTLTLILQVAPDLDATRGEQLITDLEREIAAHGFEHTFIAGRKYLEVWYNRLANRDLTRSLALAAILIVVFLGFVYRNVWGVLFPLLIFILSMVTFMGYLSMIGRPLDAMASLYPTILLIVSISDVIHIFTRIEEKRASVADRRAAIIQALDEVGLTIFLTSMTTAAGFLILSISPIPAAQHFGKDVAVGVMLTYFFTIALIPALLFTIRRVNIQLRKGFQHVWDSLSLKFPQFISRSSRLIWIISAILLLLSSFWITGMNTNNIVSSAFPNTHPVKKAVNFFDHQLAGTRTFEIAVMPEQGKLLNDLALLREMEKLHTWLDSLPEIKSILSPATYYKSLNKSWSGGRMQAYKLPDSQAQIEAQERQLEPFFDQGMRQVISKDKEIGKFSARIPDIGRKKVQVLNEKTKNFIHQSIDTNIVRMRITGASMMFDKVQEHSIRNMFRGLLIAIGGIGILIAFVFRNFRMVLVTILANTFPLILTGALMAIFQIELRYGTSMIFTIGFVIAVDDTIHFLANYKLQRSKGLPVMEALHDTFRHTGRAILITTMVLFLAFFNLVFSSFRDTHAMGLLLSFMLIIAMIADLVLLPVMLRRLDKMENLE